MTKMTQGSHYRNERAKYKCPYCDFTCRYKDTLRKHKLKCLAQRDFEWNQLKTKARWKY